MCFDKNDVLIIAKAVAKDYSDFNSGDYSNDYYNCLHCNGVSPGWATSEKQIKHDLDCPVLVAWDVLTT